MDATEELPVLDRRAAISIDEYTKIMTTELSAVEIITSSNVNPIFLAGRSILFPKA